MADKQTTSKSKTGAEIAFCNCESPYQDKKYGAGKRVHNLKGNAAKGHSTCTVCGKVK